MFRGGEGGGTGCLIQQSYFEMLSQIFNDLMDLRQTTDVLMYTTHHMTLA